MFSCWPVTGVKGLITLHNYISQYSGLTQSQNKVISCLLLEAMREPENVESA